MVFSGIPFLYFFLPATILLYLIAPKRLKNTVLLIASLVFYAWGEQKLVLLFAGSIVLSWCLGLLIGRFQGKPLARVILILSLLLNLGALGYFKYMDFFISAINGALGLSIPLLRIALPIGISFYTFQMLSYTVDVYRGTVPSQKNLIDYAAYVSLFPQLIAGPIVRYSDVSHQLKNRVHTLDQTAAGARRFVFGLAKKVLIADAMGALCAAFRGSSDPSVLFYWLFTVAYALQIYFDFSAYSDMAIGLGKIFGFQFIENFDYPYCSRSVTEFWRRWHISLGSWFRDYVYIPMGGNRRGTGRQILNILVVWMLTGLWHGADWNFVLWGLFYAVLLINEKLWLKKHLDRHQALGHFYVILTVLFGFLLFQAVDLSELASDISGLFAFGRLPLVSAEALYYLRYYAVTLVIACIGATPLMKQLTKKYYSVLRYVEPLVVALLLLLVTGYLVDGSFSPFLYFRF